jgi:hypothetical protein
LVSSLQPYSPIKLFMPMVLMAQIYIFYPTISHKIALC